MRCRFTNRNELHHGAFVCDGQWDVCQSLCVKGAELGGEPAMPTERRLGWVTNRAWQTPGSRDWTTFSLEALRALVCSCSKAAPARVKRRSPPSFFSPARHSARRLSILCGAACKRDPVMGVIGVKRDPHLDGLGASVWLKPGGIGMLIFGDGGQDPARARRREVDQGDRA